MPLGLEIEPLTRLECLNYHCVHNLRRRNWYCCNLKYIMLSETGQCIKFEHTEDALRPSDNGECPACQYGLVIDYVCDRCGAVYCKKCLKPTNQDIVKIGRCECGPSKHNH